MGKFRQSIRTEQRKLVRGMAPLPAPSLLRCRSSEQLDKLKVMSHEKNAKGRIGRRIPCRVDFGVGLFADLIHLCFCFGKFTLSTRRTSLRHVK